MTPSTVATGKPLRQRLTGLVKGALYAGGVVGLMRRLGAPGHCLPVIRYHSVATAPDYCPPGIAVPPEQFEREVAYLAANYDIVTLDVAVRCLRERRSFPERGVVITFDDGYKDNVETALPILAQHGATAMFYVAAGPAIERSRFWVGWLQRAVFAADPNALVTALELPRLPPPGDRQDLVDAIAERINRGSLAARRELLERVEAVLGGPASAPDGVDFMMDAADLQTLRDAGMEIGSHTVSHPILTALDDTEVRVELARSRSLLEAALGQPVAHLAYPSGPRDPVNFDRRITVHAAECGYLSAVTSERGAWLAESDALALPRHAASQRFGLAEFAFKVEEHRFTALLLR